MSKFNTKELNVDFFGKMIKMNIFDYDYYAKNNINDEGLDIISKCLESGNNCWEPYQTEITKGILKDGNNIFVDIGSHLGYYSLLSAALGNHVYSIDSSEVYNSLFRRSIYANRMENIKIHKKRVNERFSLDEIISSDTDIKLIKCDIEGYEIEFVDSIFDRLKNHNIENLILEISPTIRSNYPEYVLKIKNLGYNVYDIGLSPQRKLNEYMKLSSLQDRLLQINDMEQMTRYINGFPEKQSNFLFSINKY